MPDFAIIGAQRCGTTSLYRALTEHDDIGELVIGAKGAHYFDTNYSRSLDWYQAHFPTERERAREAGACRRLIVGESSPYYFFHPAVAERLHAVASDVRLIVLLRDPVARAYSQYQHMIWEGHEHLPTFEQAIEAEADRLVGATEYLLEDPSHRSSAHQHASYLARGHYAEQLERYLALFSAEQMLVLITEQLVADPQAGLEQIQSFLGVEPSSAVVLRQHNSGSYDPIRPSTRRSLESHFAASSQRLTELTGLEPPWG